MKGWLMKHLIQDTPEELSVCEFDCRKSHCTARIHAECGLRKSMARGSNDIVQCSTRVKEPEPITEWQPIWIYEAMPFVYLFAAFTISYYFESIIGYCISGILLIAALFFLAKRIKYRSRNALSLDKSPFSHRSNR